jgi:hypothetical protein
MNKTHTIKKFQISIGNLGKTHNNQKMMSTKIRSKIIRAITPLAFLLAGQAIAQPTITPMDSPEALAQSLVGPGIKISNIQYTGNVDSAGYFTGGYAKGNDISSGVILTTGLASSAGAKKNKSSSTSFNSKVAGDSLLNTLIPGYSTYDATVLSFDFVSSGDSAFFNFSFASEEYVEWVGSSYNDVFGFFVDGENVALLPNSDTAVSINSVSNLNNSDLFNDNSIVKGKSPYAFEYDGFTDVFTAEITGLAAGEIYNIRLGIADAGDAVYDSAVFLQAGSFAQTMIAAAPSGAPEPSTALMMAIALSCIVYRMRFSTDRSAAA